MSFKVGNYVRCPIDEDITNPREFLFGKIININDITEEVTIKFYDIYDKNKFFDHIPRTKVYYKDDVIRCKIRNKSMAIYKDKFACRIISNYKDENRDFFKYYVEPIINDRNIIVVNEKDLAVQYDDANYNPVMQLVNYELHNPIWYKKRAIVSESQNIINNAPIGFELLLGSRVYLFSHQIDTIMKGIAEEKCRMMLADEVGLGKTIEACVIFVGLKQAATRFRCIFIVPRSLTNQWKNELSYKFWLDVPIWEPDFIHNKSGMLLLAIEDIHEYLNESDDLNWDMCIVDETHRLLNKEDQYEKICKISRKVDNILLLSATPIQQRKTEYLSLLKLLDPGKYSNMPEEEFDLLISKSRKVKDKIYELTKDLKYFYEDELWDDYYIEELEDLNDILKDEILAKLINSIDINSEDKGLEVIKIALAYISNTYEIEKNIIRNRRLELADNMAQRTQQVLKYEMADSNYNYYEYETYNELLNYLGDYTDKHKPSTFPNVNDAKEMISAMLSSPWALGDKINSIIANLNGEGKVEEAGKLTKLEKMVGRWKIASKSELDNMEHYEDYPDEIKGRLLRAIDYLDENFIDNKVVIFTQWTETAIVFEKYLKKKTGENTVVSFFEGKSMEELELSVDRFQSDEECRFLVCDKLGGEGRNFQMADAILHLDIPWSPIDLEQRIGRLDRIGRDKSKDVLSIVMLADGTLELDLYNLWDKGLNIFNESLSGIEIALNDVENEINNALTSDVKYGLGEAIHILADSITNMRNEVEKERYYDYAKRLNPLKDKKLKTLIEKFDSDGGKQLRLTMDSWANLVGLSSRKMNVLNSKGEEDMVLTYLPDDFSINSAKVTLFNPPDTREALKRSRKKRVLQGTFSTDIAVNREDLIFFSPGDAMYESIINNAMKAYRGRSTALAIRADFEWLGLVFKWNTGFNFNHLLNNGYGINIKYDISDYLFLDQITTVHPISKSSREIEDYKVKNILEDWINMGHDKGAVHLGKRSNTPMFFRQIGSNKNIEWFKKSFPLDVWKKVVINNYKRSYLKARKQARKLVLFNEAEDYFDDIITSVKARNLYFNEESLQFQDINNLLQQKDSVLEGLRDLNVELDSVALLWVVNQE